MMDKMTYSVWEKDPHMRFVKFELFIVYSLQVTLSIELKDSQVDEFQEMIPVQLAKPPWNYTQPLDKKITVQERQLENTSHCHIR